MTLPQNSFRLNRQNEAEAISFCLRQTVAFSECEWLAFDAIPKRDVAAIANFLAQKAWYGRSSELRAIAGKLSSLEPVEIMRSCAIDLPRFVGMLKIQKERDGTD